MQEIDQIKQKLDIVDVIKEYVQLKSAGMNFKANCPFHQEKSPSFIVSPDKQIYHCFGCGKGGDMFTFVQEIEGVDFVGALKILASKAGVVLTRQNPKMISKKNKVLDIMDLSRRYFYKVLIETKQAEFARQYLKDRGLKQETIDEWQIGYSFDSWDALLKFLIQKGFSNEDIIDSGMVIPKNNKQGVYDRFRGRIMFPILDVNSNTIAFSARVSPQKEAEEKQGKYINSPQTIVYDKSSVLFGLSQAKIEIKKQDFVIVVEGQMDVIQTHQAGFKNVVASSGTALTKNQLILLKRYTNNIYFCFDMDKAGELASERGIKEAMEEDMNIKIIELPEGKDPDECIRKDVNQWINAVKNAKLVMQYYFDKTLAKYDVRNIEEKRKATQIILTIIKRIKNKIEQDFWLKKLAEIVDVEEGVLREIVFHDKQEKEKKSLNNKQKNNNPDFVNQNKEKINKIKKKEEYLSELLISLLFNNSFLFEYALKNIKKEYLFSDFLQSIYKHLLLYYNDYTKNINFEDFKLWLKEKIVNEENKNIYEDELNKLFLLSGMEYERLSETETKNEMISLGAELKKIYLKNEMKRIEREIAKIEKLANSLQSKEIILKLMKNFTNLSEEFRNLK